MDAAAFYEWRVKFQRDLAEMTIPELLSIKEEALTLDQMKIMFEDVDRRIEYLEQGSKSTKEEIQRLNGWWGL